MNRRPGADRHTARPSRVVITSGAPMIEPNLDRVLRIGAVHLTKPFEPRTLVEMLARPPLLHSAKTQSP